MLTINPVIFTDISFQSPGGKLLFLLSEPGSCPRQIWDNEDRQKGDEDLCGN
jgi:hypothetical protein